MARAVVWCFLLAAGVWAAPARCTNVQLGGAPTCEYVTTECLNGSLQWNYPTNSCSWTFAPQGASTVRLSASWATASYVNMSFFDGVNQAKQIGFVDGSRSDERKVNLTSQTGVVHVELKGPASMMTYALIFSYSLDTSPDPCTANNNSCPSCLSAGCSITDSGECVTWCPFQATCWSTQHSTPKDVCANRRSALAANPGGMKSMSMSLLAASAAADILSSPPPQVNVFTAASSGSCPKITCVMFCTNGLQKDEKGCDKCSCVKGAGKLATGVNGCKRDANGCCSELGMAWCPEQSICVSTLPTAVIRCQSWGRNPPVTGASAQAVTTQVSSSGLTQSPNFAQPSSSSTQLSSSFAQPSSSTQQASTFAQLSSSFTQPSGLTQSSNFAQFPNFAQNFGQSSNFAQNSNFAQPSSLGLAQGSAQGSGLAQPAAAFAAQSSFSQSSFPPQSLSFAAPALFPNFASSTSVQPSSTFAQPFVSATVTSWPPQSTGSVGLAGSGLTSGNALLGSSSSQAGGQVSATSQSQCSNIMCMMFCPNGFQKDARGCDICSCASVSNGQCAPTDCGGSTCAGGFSKDSSGCPTCICLTGSVAAPIQGSSASSSTSAAGSPLIPVDHPSITLNPCLPAPGPCKASQTCVPSPKQCITTPCPQYTCVKAGKSGKSP